MVFVEKVKFCYSFFFNGAPNCDMLMNIRLVVIIMYGTSQNMQQVSLKKGKAPNHFFKVEVWPGELKTGVISLHRE